jgi:hypothetical protein
MLDGAERLLPVVVVRRAGVTLGRWLQMRETTAQLPATAFAT